LKMRTKLKKITIGGYKSFAVDHPQEVELGDINILIGANGAGKSNFVSFFKMLNMMTTRALQIFIGQQGGANSLLHYGSKKSLQMFGKLFFESYPLPNKVNTNEYSFKLTFAANDTLIFTEESTAIEGRKPVNLDVGQKETALNSDNANRVMQVFHLILKKCQFFQFHDTALNSYIRTTTKINDCHYLYADGGNLAAYLRMLEMKHQKYYHRIIQWIRTTVPQFHDFFLETPPDDETILLKWREKESEYIFGPNQISDGSLRFMALATLLLQPPELLPDIVIIDEPELGLHPAAIGALAGMVRTASQHCQVILATQSPRLLDEFSPEEIIVVERDERRRCSILKQFEQDELNDWIEDYCLSELWEKNILGGQP